MFPSYIVQSMEHSTLHVNKIHFKHDKLSILEVLL